MLRVLPLTFKPVMQQIRLLHKRGVVLLFEPKSAMLESFTGPRQTCFAASDVSPVALFYPIRSQYSSNLQHFYLLQNRFERGW